jgi:sucrose-6-phosphate hydrolase SacC (GH32 family)
VTYTTKKIVFSAFVAIILIVGLYSALTFPRNLAEMEISFSIGAEEEQKEFQLPIFHDKTQVEVVISSGSALWSASITDANGSKIWEHAKAQGDQTVYTSDWIALPSGSYNFTFGTIGLGGLQANFKVTSKGGFW